MPKHLLLTLAPAVWLLASCDTLCRNDILDEVPSPDGRYRVVVFQRDCGATTGFSTQASLLQSGDRLPDQAGNLFSADTDHGRASSERGGGPEVGVKWDSNDSLVLTHHAQARVFSALTEYRNIHIRYVAIP